MPPTSRSSDVWAASASRQLRAETPYPVDAPFRWDLYDSSGPDCELLGPLHDREVIDLGCGTGRVIAHLTHAHGARATGLDSSPAMIELATARFAGVQGLSLVTADAVEHLAQHPRGYDAVVSRFGAVCFTDPLLLLPLVAAALRPGGHLRLRDDGGTRGRHPGHRSPVHLARSAAAARRGHGDHPPAGPQPQPVGAPARAGLRRPVRAAPRPPGTPGAPGTSGGQLGHPRHAPMTPHPAPGARRRLLRGQPQTACTSTISSIRRRSA
ncbi:hypothetical protein CTZ27_29560 [Streptomyces griseocarneus]|nr:hypothetical protein CTZ27_29560 [Streptomyces griseocarneus]